jgi:cytochrome c peroxidase
MKAITVLSVVCAGLVGFIPIALGIENWTNTERKTILEMQVERNVPADLTNAVADNQEAAKFGQFLFFDKRLSENGEISCATCHMPDKFFTDGKQLSEGVGMTNRNAPTAVGASWNKFQFWDGRVDSLWAQALGPIENSAEHGFTRSGVAQVVFANYKDTYEQIFDSLPELDDPFRFPDVASPIGNSEAKANWNQMNQTDQIIINQIFVNVGKSIAAYERLLKPGASRVDQFSTALQQNKSTENILNSSEQNGMRLFMGKAKCVACHSGSQFSDNQFHNTGVPMVANLPSDLGRSSVSPAISNLEFGCNSIYSNNRNVCNTQPDNEITIRAYKTPSLRNIAQTAPYMHAGQFKTLRAVLVHYNKAEKAPLGTSEIQSLGLSEFEIDDLEAFLKSLNSPIDAPASYLRSPFQ